MISPSQVPFLQRKTESEDQIIRSPQDDDATPSRVCMLRKAFAEWVESGEPSFEEGVDPTPENTVRRFEHYELLTGEDGKPVELGRGAMCLEGMQ